MVLCISFLKSAKCSRLWQNQSWHRLYCFGVPTAVRHHLSIPIYRVLPFIMPASISREMIFPSSSPPAPTFLLQGGGRILSILLSRVKGFQQRCLTSLTVNQARRVESHYSNSTILRSTPLSVIADASIHPVKCGQLVVIANNASIHPVKCEHALYLIPQTINHVDSSFSCCVFFLFCFFGSHNKLLTAVRIKQSKPLGS